MSPMSSHDVSNPYVEQGRPVPRGLGAHGWTGLLLGCTVVVLALVVGLNFAFSAAIMPNLADADDQTFVEITQRFNQNPVFPLAFMAALLLMAAATVLHGILGPAAARRWTVVAMVLYAVVLAITFGFHIPLNEQIDAVGSSASAAELADAREEFETPWVVGNVVRTLVCIAALAALTRSLLLHRRERRRTGGAGLPPVGQ